MLSLYIVDKYFFSYMVLGVESEVEPDFFSMRII